MASRDNFSALFGGGGASSVPSVHQNKNKKVVATNSTEESDSRASPQPALSSTEEEDDTTDKTNTHDETNEHINNGELLVGWHAEASSCVPQPSASDVKQQLPTAPQSNHHNNNTKPGTESIQYIKQFGNNILGSTTSRLRELQLAEKLNSFTDSIDRIEDRIENNFLRKSSADSKNNSNDEDIAERMNAMNTQIEKEVERNRRIEKQYQLEEQFRREQEVKRKQEEMLGDQSSEQLARVLQDQDEQEECQRVKVQADMACKRVGWRYDALRKFIQSCPCGTYEEWIEFLLMGGGRSENNIDDEGFQEECNNLLFENFYAEKSEYRLLWNDNLMLGLPKGASTMEGRSFVPATLSTCEDSSAPTSKAYRQRTYSEEERVRNLGGRIKNQIAHLDKQQIKQGLGSAVSALSNVSSFALKPLRDLQLAEKLNAMNLDAEEEEARKEIEQYNRVLQDKKDLEEMMALKEEAEASCMLATKEHLLAFIKQNPNAKYHEWIEDFHPENAHDGSLLSGLGKTIDHRFYVEESDHRRLWNDNLFTFLDPSNGSKGRDYVPARAKQMDDHGKMVLADDILSGSVGRDLISPQQHLADGGMPEDKSYDLIAFD